jgi:tripartite-type tricarboxylate transporter receptor subunit TctC
MRTKTTSLLLMLAGLVAMQAVLATGASSQTDAKSWPQRTVRLVLPFGPASGADIAARLLAERLQVTWGRPVVVEGKPGGDGLLSIGTVVNAKDDHVLFFGPSSAYVVHPYVHENLPYDPDRDLTPIAGVARVLICVTVPTSMGINTLQAFVDHARANPGTVSYGVAPGFSEFVWNGFVKETGLQVAKVPYRDITTAPTDLQEGRIQALMQSFAAMRPSVQGGKVTLIAMASAKRADVAPTIPTVGEAGFPSLEASPVLGMLGPRDMALDVRRKAAADVVAVLKDQVVVDRLNQTGQTPEAMDVDQFAAAVKYQHDRVAAIAKVLGLARKK